MWPWVASISTPYPILRGVSLGYILGPLFINIFLSDLFLSIYSHLCIYVCEITIISRLPTVTEAQRLLRLTVSTWKSVIMCFILKSSPAPPIITLCREAIPYTTTHKLLGLQLDDPQMSWSKHVKYLHSSCHQRINKIVRITGVNTSITVLNKSDGQVGRQTRILSILKQHPILSEFKWLNSDKSEYRAVCSVG